MSRRAGAVMAGVGAAIAVTLLLAYGYDDALELPLRDRAMRALPRRNATSSVVVAIDERALRDLGRWPWKRATLAQIVDRAADGGARAIVLDVLLVEASDGDEQLARAMRRIPSIAVSVLDEHGEWLVPAPLLRAAAIPSHGNFELDHDGILRTLASTKQSRDRALTAVSVEAASILTDKPVPVGQAISPMFRTRPRDVPQISASQFLAQSFNVKNKVVFFGPTALGLGDRVLTPVALRHLPDPGVTVHAAAMESLLRNDKVHELPPIVAGLLAGLLVWSAGLRPAGPPASRPPLIVSLTLILVAAILFATAGLALPIVILLICIALVQIVRVVIARNRIAAQFREHRVAEAESKRVLAHELKTPLASMRGLTQLLGRFELNDGERRRVTSLLESEAGKLETMVHALLDLERLPLRDFNASTSVIDLGQIVDQRVDFLRLGVDRQLIVHAQRDLFVRADAALIERVVDNLVGNAIKYSPADVTINVRAIGDRAVLEVEDRGPGIAEADRVRIFDRFYRGATATGTQGLGLGLSLVAEVAKWHGGSVRVDGSKFSFELPGAA